MRIESAAIRLLVAACAAAASVTPVGAVQAQQGSVPTACASAAAPDGAAPVQRTQSVSQRDTGHVALRILASATADEVRFVGTPRVCVRLTGDAQLDSVHVLARRNITSPVVSNTTYRNVYVAVEILGRLNADCITGRITGAASDSSRTLRCAGLDARGTSGASPP